MNTKSGKNYQSIRIFKSDILEWCTHVHPIIPLLLWSPISLYWFINGMQVGNVFSMIAWPIIGIVCWTLVEYLMHRFVFHFPAKSKGMKRFVYLFHGLHHDDPNDPTRLVFPPVPAILIMSLLYLLFSLIIPAPYLYLYMAGFVWGYLCYDYIHFATHHFNMTSKVGRFLKKYHLQHHHFHEPVKFGVSSPLWDFIFRTRLSTKERKQRK